MSTLACQSEDGNNAIFVGTFLESGKSVTVCRDCLEAFAVALAQELSGVPVIDLVAKYADNSATVEPEVTLTDEEAEQQAWLTDHREAIEAVMGDGATFDEAVAIVLEIKGELPDSTSDSTSAAN